MGYLLRHLEVEVCPSAEILHGLDIDTYAIETGMQHLRSLQSKVTLFAGDMAQTEVMMGDHNYDIVLCCGVLMYVNEATAEHVVRTMFSRARSLVGIICLAGAELNGAASGRSVTRASDGAFVHDMDKMIRRAGGKIVSSKLVAHAVSGSSPSYAILAEPAHNRRVERAICHPPSSRFSRTRVA
jgi:hypothetical protein